VKALSKEDREYLRDKAERGPVLIGSPTALALLDENARLRGAVVRAWSACLEVVLEEKFEDGTLVMQAVLRDQKLRARLYAVLGIEEP
jgi:hypothetical protein